MAESVGVVERYNCQKFIFSIKNINVGVGRFFHICIGKRVDILRCWRECGSGGESGVICN